MCQLFTSVVLSIYENSMKSGGAESLAVGVPIALAGGLPKIGHIIAQLTEHLTE
jgi:hypothetical protein